MDQLGISIWETSALAYGDKLDFELILNPEVKLWQIKIGGQ
jgi:hypothetical protein